MVTLGSIRLTLRLAKWLVKWLRERKKRKGATPSVTCKSCKKELPRDHKGPCPFCGSNEILFQISVGDGAVGIKGTLSAVHEAHWSAKSYAILAILLTLFFGLVSLISYGIYELLALPTGLKIALSVIVFCTLVIVGWWQNYRVLMFTQWLDRKSVAKKTYKYK